MKKKLTFILAAALAASLSACGSNSEMEKLKEENKALKEALKNSQASTAAPTAAKSESQGLKAHWEPDSNPKTLEVDGSVIVISDDMWISKYSNSNILVLNFTYTNNSDTAKNFINDNNVNVNLYQGGIELSSPGVMSNGSDFDTSNSFTRLKDGASLNTQLAFKLLNTADPIEAEIGKWGDTSQQIKKKIILSN
jgi:hypothetical protein